MGNESKILTASSCRVIPAEHPAAPLIVVEGEEASPEELCSKLRLLTDRPFHLVLHPVADWNDCLSPWPADPIMKKAEPFGGNADRHLQEITDQILPELLQTYEMTPEWCGIAGYSLGGLFSIYSMYQTACFDRFVSASGSMWYPGFLNYCRTHAPKKQPQAVYLSLGDAEAKTRHAILKTVQNCTEELAAYYQANEIPVQYELNPGNHFKDAVRRLAKGIAWILDQK